MAIAVIGGLIVSTMLSLVFVPAVFTVLDDVGRISWRLCSRLFGEADEEEPEVERPKPPQPLATAAPKARPTKDVAVAAE
jgi:uncharacterized membrane protein